jgi:hypothetical protein
MAPLHQTLSKKDTADTHWSYNGCIGELATASSQGNHVDKMRNDLSLVYWASEMPGFSLLEVIDCAIAIANGTPQELQCQETVWTPVKALATLQYSNRTAVFGEIYHGHFWDYTLPRIRHSTILQHAQRSRKAFFAAVYGLPVPFLQSAVFLSLASNFDPKASSSS